MCGIIAYLGNEHGINISLDGLLQLQNRGYDSAGISYIDKSNTIQVHKFASTHLKNAIQILREKKNTFQADNVIGHTRWATHGERTDINSHPHLSNDKQFSLVHNGIIENYQELKVKLMKQGYTFYSETDTEVIVNLLSFYYDICLDTKKAIEKTIQDLQGTWGLVIQCSRYPDVIFATCHGSPLLVGKENKEIMIVSEYNGFCGRIKEYFVAEDGDIIIVKSDYNGINIETNHTYRLIPCKGQITLQTPEPYKHWTIREIYEQINTVKSAIGNGSRIRDGNIMLGGLNDNKNALLEMDNLIFLGCGTSFFSALYASQLYKELDIFNNIQLIDGAEFTEYDIPKVGKTLCIFISQSGETKDLHRCIRIINQHQETTLKLGVINVVGSQIAREMDCGCYLNAGREVAVASTKSFTSQIVVLHLIALWFSQQKNLNYDINRRKISEKWINDTHQLSSYIDSILNDKELYFQILQVAKYLKNHRHCFILGKGRGESVAKEGSLKMKEITYIHSEGYSTSSLKHGPFALLEQNFPVILLCLKDEYREKSLNAYDEIKARYAHIIIITDDKNITKDKYNDATIIHLPNCENNLYKHALSIIPLQLLAYELSVIKGINPDMPRNLAKVVTVE